jgi:phospholipid N-methyltransferase
MNSIYQQYYTKSSEIVAYMIDKLSIKSNSIVLEPCAGDGVFLDALLNTRKEIKIDAFELDPSVAAKLIEKYKAHNNILIRNEDTLLNNDFISGAGKKYDFIIANPPYGAWQNYEKRKLLKNIYPNLYIKETYSTFLFLSVSLLKENGRLVFITPDTYLNLHMHTFLRRFILKNSLIEEISVFPSSFFPGVNFGYSKLSIITLVKSNNLNTIMNNQIKIIDNYKEPIDLITMANAKTIVIKQEDVYNNFSHAFILSENKHLLDLLKKSNMYIGDIANCVTGIYTGDDKHFIKVKDHSIKNGKKYEIILKTEINEVTIPDLNGFAENIYIPIIKGGNTKYIKNNQWFINWSKDAVLYYKTNQKSRFQNSQFYFKQGIAVPMVSSNCVTASIINNRIFDQSIVGVFPKENIYILYLLAFFNTNICTKLLRLINPSANNSSNYIKKLPIIIPEYSTLTHINSLVETILLLKAKNENTELVENEINSIFEYIFFENKYENIKSKYQEELFAI